VLGADNRGAEIEIKGGKEWGKGVPLPSQLGDLGERRKLPRRGPGQSPGRKRILEAPPAGDGAEPRPKTNFGVFRAGKNTFHF